MIGLYVLTQYVVASSIISSSFSSTPLSQHYVHGCHNSQQHRSNSNACFVGLLLYRNLRDNRISVIPENYSFQGLTVLHSLYDTVLKYPGSVSALYITTSSHLSNFCRNLDLNQLTEIKKDDLRYLYGGGYMYVCAFVVHVCECVCGCMYGLVGLYVWVCGCVYGSVCIVNSAFHRQHFPAILFQHHQG